MVIMNAHIKNSFSVLKETAVAGLKFCLNSNNVVEQIFWSMMGLLGIFGISCLFFIQIESWSSNPIIVSRKWVDLPEVEFPAITFCHPGNTRLEVADRLLQAADEKSPKMRALRSLFLKHSLEYLVEKNEVNGELIKKEPTNYVKKSRKGSLYFCSQIQYNFGSWRAVN